MLVRFVRLTFLLCLAWTSAAGQVTIRLMSLPLRYTPESDTLFLAGNFNNWNPRDSAFRFRKNGQNQWEVRLTTPFNPIEYKVTRGNWASVEVAATGQDIANRSTVNTPNALVPIQVADWADTRGTHTVTSQVQVITSQLWLPSLKRYRRIWVCLPSDYASQPARRYPVMYFHDGQNVFDAATSFSGEWKADEALLQLEAISGWSSMIVVAVDNGGADRISELTPFRNQTYGGGDGEKYALDLVTRVKPLIDNRFRTLTGAGFTGIGGSSLGGIQSLYMAYRYPEVFSKALIFSPALWFSDSLRQFCLNQPPPVNSRMYWVCGTNEGSATMVPLMNQCYSDLISSGMPANQMTKFVVTGGTHSENFWASQVKDGLLWLFPTTTTSKKKEEVKKTVGWILDQEGLQLTNQNPGQKIDYELYNFQGRELRKGSFCGATEHIRLPRPNQCLMKLTVDGTSFVDKIVALPAW